MSWLNVNWLKTLTFHFNADLDGFVYSARVDGGILNTSPDDGGVTWDAAQGSPGAGSVKFAAGEPGGSGARWLTKAITPADAGVAAGQFVGTVKSIAKYRLGAGGNIIPQGVAALYHAAAAPDPGVSVFPLSGLLPDGTDPEVWNTLPAGFTPVIGTVTDSTPLIARIAMEKAAGFDVWVDEVQFLFAFVTQLTVTPNDDGGPIYVARGATLEFVASEEAEWAVEEVGGGSIVSTDEVTGLYTAPMVDGTYTIDVTSPNDTNGNIYSIQVIVNETGLEPEVGLSPVEATIAPGETLNLLVYAPDIGTVDWMITNSPSLPNFSGTPHDGYSGVFWDGFGNVTGPYGDLAVSNEDDWDGKAVVYTAPIAPGTYYLWAVNGNNFDEYWTAVITVSEAGGGTPGAISATQAARRQGGGVIAGRR